MLHNKNKSEKCNLNKNFCNTYMTIFYFREPIFTGKL